MSASGVPIFLAASVDDEGTTVSLGQECSSVSVQNLGTNSVQVAFGGDTPYILANGEFINLPRVAVSSVVAVCATGETANIQIAAVAGGFVGFSLEEVATA